MPEFNATLIEEAYSNLKDFVTRTPLQLSARLSEKYGATVYLKREDLQVVRSYKLRGAYNRISRLTDEERKRGVVCASAGNHAQGVAFSCAKLNIQGRIFMPRNTPKQKVERVRILGGAHIAIELVGDTYDDSCAHALTYCDAHNNVFVHPFDDVYVMAGQGTIGVEILEQLEKAPDMIIAPVGGGGLISGLHTYMKARASNARVIGVEPEGAASMTLALQEGKVTTLPNIDKFVDGAAVRTVGVNPFQAVKNTLEGMCTVPEGLVCTEMIGLYQNEGIITEPAGALSVAALDVVRNQIKGKTVVCIVSGGNNDISRYAEILDRSLIYQGLKHYFLIEFSQRPGALREYLDTVLGPNDDITLFEYVKKSNKEKGPALVGIELSKATDFEPLLQRMNDKGLSYTVLDKNAPLYRFLV